jgi:putative FmdB family regulatory protein
VPIYELACEDGHRSETLQASTDPLPACPACGRATRKVPSGFGVGGTASVAPPPERMPQTWKLAGDRRPVLAHEGRFEHAPLRAGDPLPPAPKGHTHGPGAKDRPGPGAKEREGSGT